MMNFSGDMTDEMMDYLKKTTWVGYVYSIVSILFGLFAIIAPVGTLGLFIGVFGIILLIHGILLTISVILSVRSNNFKPARLLSALLELVVSIFIIAQLSEISKFALSAAFIGIGIIGVAGGIYTIVEGIRLRTVVNEIPPAVTRGILILIIGICMLISPLGLAQAMIRLMGIASLVFGVLQLLTTIRMSKGLNNNE
ncbi:MAG: DUF308 domain-containing protein [Spirochaetales bacterium]|nr:DUF308 domain-containing protein [Spirochaetales bacterium]